MAKRSENIASKLNSAKTQAAEQVEFMLQKIVILDSEKEDFDEAIKKLDLSVQQQIDEVNSDIKDAASAYNARITAGCRTVKNWVLVGVGTTVATYKCVDADTSLQQFKAMHGIKYYDEPATKDILDSTVGSFIGTCGIGSTHVTIMSIAGSGTTSGMQVGQTITCDQSGVFGSSTTIIGFTTSLADLSSVGIGVSGDIEVVDVIITSTSTGAAVTTSNPAEFDVLGIATSFEIPPVPMTQSPFVPQTIGIMNTSIVGTGTYIKYTNSSASTTKQSWNPYLEGLKIESSNISEPSVGAGTTAYNIGSTNMPSNIVGIGSLNLPPYSYVEASAGDILILDVLEQDHTVAISTYYQALPSCSSTLETNITNALSVVSTSESKLTSGTTDITGRLAASNTLRMLRNKYNIQIWGIRQTLSELYKEKDDFDEGVDYLNSSSVLDIIDS